MSRVALPRNCTTDSPRTSPTAKSFESNADAAGLADESPVSLASNAGIS
jgi:hypothetical protein